MNAIEEIKSYCPAGVLTVTQEAYLGTMISENTQITPSALVLHLRKAFFSNDFMNVWLMKHLKILQNIVEDACEMIISM